MAAAREEIIKIAQSVMDAFQFELVDLTVSVGRRPVIRIYIHGDDGVTINDCAQVSRSVEFELDNADIFGRRYSLEVSSPGLDRPLKTMRDFTRNIGNEVKLLFCDGSGVNSEQCGKIIYCDDNIVTIKTEEHESTIKMEKIVQGKLIY